MISTRNIYMRNITKIFVLTASLFFMDTVMAQSIPDSLNGVIYRGSENSIARGVLDGNLIQTNFRNHGELSRWMDIPWGVWPRDVGGRHIDGVGVLVAGKVVGNRTTPDVAPYFTATTDTILNPLSIHYRQAGLRQSPRTGDIYGWLPLPGFNNRSRTNDLGQAEPVPALSNDPSSWPDFWPDRCEEEDPCWPGTWNGRDGRFASADLESFYVMDDFSDLEYAFGIEGTGPHSEDGVYHPSDMDSTIGGLAMQMQVRIFQWANILAEDTAFLIYRITNKGDYKQDSLYFAQIVDYGLGFEEADDNANYDPLLDVVYGWDRDGIGEPTFAGQGTYDLGYTGFAFLESPANDLNGIDDDVDGITDESRFDNNYIVLSSQAEIDAYVDANYDRDAFEEFNGETVEERPAYRAGIWYTTDENLDWVGFDDANNNGIRDEGEVLNNDVGRDGLSNFDFGYPGPDEGEGDGIPTDGEPNYNQIDVDESDQIGLTGFDLGTRPEYESGDNLRDDTWLWGKIEEHLFDDPNQPPLVSPLADEEPFVLFVSGAVELANEGSAEKSTDFFSTAWIFGDDEEDFFKNRRVVQNIYNADYNFAQPPLTPELTAVAADNRVILSWDDVALQSYDRFLQDFDFEGFRLYRSSNNIFNDIRTISDVNGTPKFYEPLAQWDLNNDISGPVPVLEGEAIYDLGSNSGLAFSYIDDDVTNGKTYYYALVSYDRGILGEGGAPGIDPQESPFRVTVNQQGLVSGTSKNTAAVVPTTPPAGFIAGGSSSDLSSVTLGTATGSAKVNIINEALLKDENIYEIQFTDSAAPPEFGDARYTENYRLVLKTPSGDSTLIEETSFSTTTKVVDGFTVEMTNSSPADLDELRTGYRSNAGTNNEMYAQNPNNLDGVSTDWELFILPRIGGVEDNFEKTDSDFELLFVDPADSLYTPPRLFGSDFERADMPVFARNVTKGTPAELFLLDTDESESLTAGDQLVLAEEVNTSVYVYRYTITIDPDGNNPPDPGEKIYVSTTKQFGSGDTFQFSVQSGSVSDSLARSEMDDIFVAPDPYIGTASWERRSNSIGRGERKIEFFNLPRVCTIRIFNIRGELVRSIEHEGDFNDGSASWDLLTDNNEDVAYGVYFYHVEAKGIGEFTGKFAIVK
ncbi:MAG: hypothetical protein JJ971_06275 [Balneolaceae bacterium]|nr:hypothetical protein [Balneolaceae bacterium]MBO6647376.1 hypothetical protein [Balneolaceae bacterium]